MSRARMLVWVAAVEMGCFGSSPASRYYTLSTLPRPERAAAVTGNVVRVAQVSLPESLERPQLLRRTGPHTVEILEFERWIEPLDVLLQNALAADLGALMPETQVLGTAAPGILATRVVSVSVRSLETTTAGEVSLDAVWFVLGAGEDAPRKTQVTSVRERSAAGQPVEVAAALSRAVERLARDVAAEVQAGTPASR
jgi:uncharacterized lipoprotein YmbA